MSPSDSTRKRFWLVVGAYFSIVLVTAGGLQRLSDVQEQACRERSAAREVLREVVDVATGSATGPVDLTKIAGYETLDPSTQTYLRNLSTMLSAANKPGDLPLHDRLIALLPHIEC